MNITDEMLMAYADGELSREDCRRLETVLEQDPVLRARLEPFAMTGSSLADVFGQPMHEPIPDRLLAVITAGGRRAPAARERQVRPAGQQATGVFDAIAEALFPRGLGFASAFTLTALIAAGGTAGYLVGRVDAPSPDGGTVVALGNGDLVAAGALKVALETQPSVDDATAISSGAAAWPAVSFRSRDQSFCREYRVAGSDGKGFAGVACRSTDSQWRVVVHAEVQTAAVASDFKLLSGPGSLAVDTTVDGLKDGDVFGHDDEAAAIAKGWSVAK
jgi:anti-sigma factor RsiW